MFGDFKRLDEYIRQTFEREIEEYDRFDTHQKSEQGSVRALSMSQSQHDEELIKIDDVIQKDISNYGKRYRDEAQRIVNEMPRLPPKYLTGKIPK